MKAQTTNFKLKTLQEFAQHAIDLLNDGVGVDTHGCDLHNELFNSDYYIIGYYRAEQWLIKNTGVFNAIDIVQEYENFNFGEVNTDLSSSEAIVNMIAYIAGEEVLNTSETLQDNWDNKLSEDDISNIIEDLKKEFNL